MRNIFGTIILLLLFKISTAQIFTNNTGGLIPDSNSLVFFPISVTGLPAAMNSSFGIKLCNFTIVHQYDAQLKIWLIAPDSTVVILVNNNGFGQNFVNTTLRMDGSNGYIVNGSPPFSGNFIPIQSLNVFNNNLINPNGVWQLCIRDEVPTGSGALLTVAIEFASNPPSNPAPTGICSTTNASNCRCNDTTMTACDLLPDMTASYECILNGLTILHDSLFLDNATPNIGTGPLEIRGIDSCFCDTVQVPCSTVQCPNGSYPVQYVTQRIYQKAGTMMNYYDRIAGTMQFHPSHGHIHVDNWASYTLRVATTDPDARHWPVVGNGTKQSFCLINLGNCDANYGYCKDQLGNVITSSDLPNYGLGTITGCGTEQGIFVGNLDIYSGGLYGQQINYPGLCNDDYYVVSITDPDNHILELDDENNWVAVPVTLSLQSGNHVNKNINIIYNGLQATFTGMANPNYVYNWSFGDSTTATGYSVAHIYSQPGIYVVTMEINNGICKTYNAQIVTVPNVLGLSETSVQIESINAQPNPFNTNCIINFSISQSADVAVELINVLGKEIRSLFQGKMAKGRHQFLIDNSTLPGVYFLRITSGQQSRIMRIVKL